MLSFDLSGKTALIAGSTQGIGLAIARQFALMGATCVLIARNEAALKEVVSSLDTSAGQQHQYLVADFSNPSEVQDVVAKFLVTQRIDILVNNSGGPAAGPILTAAPERFLQAFQQHLICNHILAGLVIPGMKESGFGRIINIISTSVRIPLRNLGVSNTIRGAVASWSKTLSNEVAKFGITVNNILPGATATSRLDNIIKNKSAATNAPLEEVEQEMLAEIPAGRFGKPEEIAAVAAFLATGAAGYINGTSIPVDGGRTGTV